MRSARDRATRNIKLYESDIACNIVVQIKPCRLLTPADEALSFMDFISMQKLREYQERSISELRQCFKKGKKRVVVVLPTGSGKTSVAAGIAYNAKAYNKKIIFLAHRQELVYQAHTRFAQWGINAGIIMPPHKNYGHTVNIASIQTLIRREHYDADIVFVDECHHINSKSYLTILKRYPNAYVIGLTATPFRTDGKPLGDIFQDIITPINIKELVDLKYLVPPKYYGHKKDFRYIKTKMGEYDNKELFDAFDKSQLYGEVVSEFKRLGTGKAIVFNVNIVHSSKTCEAFRNAGYSAAHLDHETKDDERKQILSDFASAKYQILCNVSLFTEGYDLPDINTVILNRATKSKCLFMQMIGRGLRPAEGKENCIVIDHGGNVYEHGMVEDDIVYDIFKKKEKTKKNIIENVTDNAKMCEACMALVSIRATKCPHCGYEFPLPAPIETELEEIVRITIPPHLRKRWSDMTVDELKEFAELKGYKKGWVYYQLKLSKPPSGKLNYDPKIYEFFHPVHGKKSCTRAELANEFSTGTSPISDIIEGRRKSAKGWIMAANLECVGFMSGISQPGSDNPNYNPTVHKFFHRDHGMVESTRYELVKKFSLNSSHISGIINGKQKTTKGWCILDPKNNKERSVING